MHGLRDPRRHGRQARRARPRGVRDGRRRLLPDAPGRAGDRGRGGDQARDRARPEPRLRVDRRALALGRRRRLRDALPRRATTALPLDARRRRSAATTTGAGRPRRERREPRRARAAGAHDRRAARARSRRRKAPRAGRSSSTSRPTATRACRATRAGGTCRSPRSAATSAVRAARAAYEAAARASADVEATCERAASSASGLGRHAGVGGLGVRRLRAAPLARGQAVERDTGDARVLRRRDRRPRRRRSRARRLARSRRPRDAVRRRARRGVPPAGHPLHGQRRRRGRALLRARRSGGAEPRVLPASASWSRSAATARTSARSTRS